MQQASSRLLLLVTLLMWLGLELASGYIGDTLCPFDAISILVGNLCLSSRAYSLMVV